MNREEFMIQLERLLWEIPVNDREDAIAYYNDYFDEAGIENEEKVIQELGSPEKVAEMIKSGRNTSGNEYEQYTEQGYTDAKYDSKLEIPVHNPKKKKGSLWVVMIILVILAAPMLLGVGAGAVGVLIGLLASIFGIVVAIIACGASFLLSGVVLFVVGIFRLFTNLLEGLVTTGIGALLTAVGILITLLFIWLIGKWMPALIKLCKNLCYKIFHRGERGTAE